MAAIGKRHFESVYRLTRLLSRWVFLDTPDHYGGAEAERLGVSVQNPLAVTIDGEPQPDLVLVRRSEGSGGIPTPGEALLVVEVADTSLTYDRDTKLPLCAAAGIAEAWLVDLNADVIEAHSEPGPSGYVRKVRIRRGQRMVSTNLSGLAFYSSDALPPEE